MLPRLGSWLFAGLACVVFAGPSAAQPAAPASETPSGRETTYAEMRNSEDRTTQRFADRYYNLIRLQEWSNEKGTSKVMAKYVAHDPELKWVKLATVKGSGANRVVREVTVDVAKLNRACQSRVRQISVIQLKLDELAAAQPEGSATGAAEGSGEYGESGRMMASERGRGRYGYDSATGETPASEGAATVPDGGGESSAEDAVAEPPSGADDPDPLGFGELANEPPLEAPTGFGVEPGTADVPSAGYGRYNQQALAQAGDPVDKSKWASDFAAFQANFTNEFNERGVPNLGWGELADLREMNEAAEAHVVDSTADPTRQKANEIADRMGEVHWQLEYEAVVESPTGGQEVKFRLPELPPPLHIQFLIDERDDPQRWTALTPGTPIKLIGRVLILEPNVITVRVRLDGNAGS
jgi:hypothetical protein